ncbi:MAG: chemotaxis protein CheA [Bryobacteraceae bacterium]
MEDNELVTEFLVESQENLDRVDRDLLALEKNPRDTDTLASVFRAVHTIKGTSGFFGFKKLESVTHVGENLLSRLRDGHLTLNPEMATALLAMMDALREILASVETSGLEGNGDYDALVQRLAKFAGGSSTASTSEAPVVIAAPVIAPPKASSGEAQEASGAGDIKTLQEAVSVAGAVAGAPEPADMSAAVHQPESAHDAHDAAAKGKGDQPKPGNLADSNIRVDVGLLDKLMDLVGELVLARNQVLQYTATQQDPAFVQTSQRLNLITTELQEGVMKTRMQPIGNVWSKFPRVVRDLAVMCGKQIRVEMDGKETELDKTIIEAIKDPLTHIVRNSADHGIEPPPVRVSRGKPAEGRILLRAFHEGGQVIIEISDDGGGIDPVKVRERAVQRGLITREEATRMNDREVLNLIFAPGFSTAEKVTNVSGRGVGMDVVKTNIEKIGGAVDVQSRVGQGTVLKIKIPLTLAIIPALIVSSGGDSFAIPQVSLLELVRLEGEDARRGIETIHGTPVYRLRGNLLPLVDLSAQLNVEPASAAGEGVVNIVVLQADGRQFGLIVESINDTEEIVVKPLAQQLKGLQVFAGATIMGDGRVALILDVLGIAQRANVVSEIRDRSMAEKAAASGENREALQTLLLCNLRGQGRMAIPLSSVARLEEFSRTMVESAGGRDVVQYRSRIMPLIRLSDALYAGGGGGGEADPMQVVVYSEGGRSVGLIVDDILDIVNERLQIGLASGRQGVLGSAVIQKRVTDLLDIRAIIEANDPSFFEPSSLETSCQE